MLEAPGYLSKVDNGGTSRDGKFGRVLASLAALKTSQPRPEQFEQLLTEAVLTRLLCAHTGRAGRPGAGRRLRVQPAAGRGRAHGQRGGLSLENDHVGLLGR